jgi:Leucine-rich repeat (LRR) protein
MQIHSAESHPVAPGNIDLANVITKDLLEECVEECEDGYEIADFAHVLRVRMSFKGIADLLNFESFVRLEFLCLSNNRIKMISSLPVLPSLTWLDVSFNSIESLQAVHRESFPSLRSLCLYSNEMKSLAFFPPFEKLEILSVGRNRLTEIDDISFLQQLPCLHALNISDNPMNCPDLTYRVSLYLPGLKYLNYERLP